METPSAAWDPAELGAHAEWIRGLALQLVRDAASADDLVQETFLAALEKRPASDSSLRPWLRRVLYHRFAFGVRSDARRRTREETRAMQEALPPSDELVENAEAHARLVQELTRLREPYRTALLLRYFEGRTPQEIAQRQGLPAATVRSHLKRGLAELRERLDRHDGAGRRAWALALIPLAVTSRKAALPGGPLTSLAKPIRAMNPLTQTLVGSTLLIATATFIARQIDPASPGGTLPAAAPGAPALEVAAASTGAANARESVAPGSAGLALSSADQKVTGMVVDSGSGTPLPEFTLELRTYTLDEEGNEVLVVNDPESVVTDEDGRFQTERAYAAGTSLNVRMSIDPGMVGAVRSDQATWTTGGMIVVRCEWDPDQAPLHLEVRVGPTYTLELTAPFDWRSTELEAWLGPLEEEPWSVLQGCTLMHTQVRGSSLPWVRFDQVVPPYPESRPWVLRVETPDGLYGGEVQVPPGDGIHAGVVPVTITPTAKLLVNLVSDMGVTSSNVVARAVHGSTRRVLLGGAQEQRSDGRFRCCRVLGGIPPGQYDLLVTCGGVEPIQDTVTLLPGQVLTHDIEVPQAPALAYVRGELHSVSGQYREQCRIVLASRSGTDWKTVQPQWEERGGEWVAPFEIPHLAECEYDLRFESARDYLRWTPLPATVTPPLEDLILTCHDTDPVRTLKFVVTDAVTGEAVQTPFAYLTVEGCSFSQMTLGHIFEKVPVDASFSWWLIADGHVPAFGDESDMSGTEPFTEEILYHLIPVSMQPGWGARIDARQVDTGDPLEGVEVLVDGLLIGMTDSTGRCDLTLEEPPASVELRRTGWRYVSGAWDADNHALKHTWPVKTVRFERAP